MIVSDIVNPAMVILNASTAYGTADDVKKYPTAFLNELAIAASDEVCEAVLVTAGHPFRANFKQTTAGIADEDFVAIAGYQIYDIFHVEVDGSPARLKPWTYVDRMRSDPLSRTAIDKYYALRERKIKHNGSSAVCDVIAFQKSASTPQAPDGLLNACISGLLKMASSKMGVNVEAASFFAAESWRHIQMIQGGAIAVPEVVAFSKMDQVA